jgi:hypothetical protein
MNENCVNLDHGVRCLLTGFVCQYYGHENQCIKYEFEDDDMDDNWVDSDFPLSEEK